VRIGRLLEDMDVFAVHLGKSFNWLVGYWIKSTVTKKLISFIFCAVFKHVLNPRQQGSLGSPFSIVTALVDQIDLNGPIFPTMDIKMSGMCA
jgi:hypothetical protein